MVRAVGFLVDRQGHLVLGSRFAGLAELPEHLAEIVKDGADAGVLRPVNGLCNGERSVKDKPGFLPAPQLADYPAEIAEWGGQFGVPRAVRRLADVECAPECGFRSD